MSLRPCWGTWQHGETSEWCLRLFFFPSITVLPQAPGWRSVAQVLSIRDGLVPSSLQPLLGQVWPLLPHSDHGHTGGISLAWSLAAVCPAPCTHPALGIVWTVGASTCSAPSQAP